MKSNIKTAIQCWSLVIDKSSRAGGFELAYTIFGRSLETSFRNFYIKNFNFNTCGQNNIKWKIYTHGGQTYIKIKNIKKKGIFSNMMVRFRVQ